MAAAAGERTFRGEPAIELKAGELSATFLPNLGMTGVSLRYRGREHLALPGGLDTLRRGGTLGLPLLAPWANRLASRHYRAAGVAVDLTGLPLHTDGNGLPIHGLLVGQPGWKVIRYGAYGNQVARLHASIDVDAPAFPFPHRIELQARARETQLEMMTTVIPTGRRRVPVAFGWHPYLRLPGTPRSRWRLRLPARTHLELAESGIPTGASQREPEEAAPIAGRTFDDLYRLVADRRLALEGDDGSSIELDCGRKYTCAQVWVPPRRPFAALEPMMAPVNALGDGTAPLVLPGDHLTARFVLNLSGPAR